MPHWTSSTPWSRTSASALEWTLGSSGPWVTERLESGLSLLEQMYPYWYRFSHAAEGREWHERALARLRAADARRQPAGSSTPCTARGSSPSRSTTSPPASALERALEMAHRLRDPYREARESNSLGVARRLAGDPRSALRLLEKSLRIARTEHAPRLQASALSNLVGVHMDLGQYPAAVGVARAAVSLDRELDDEWGLAVDRTNFAFALLYAQGHGGPWRSCGSAPPQPWRWATCS